VPKLERGSATEQIWQSTGSDFAPLTSTPNRFT